MYYNKRERWSIMTKTTEQKQIKELETKLAKACELIQKQQKAHVAFKSQYIELINLLEKNQNGSFTISNYVEDELIIKGWTTKKDVIVNNQNRIFFALFENASYLMNSKDYFIITPSNGATLGNAKDEVYQIEIDYNKIPDAKKAYLNKAYNLDMPLAKQDDRLIRDEVAEEINQFIYSLTGKTIEY